MIQYKHQNAPGYLRATFAVDPLPKKMLERMAKDEVRGAMMKTGITYVHPKDQFEKAEGRANADEKLALTMVFITDILDREDGRTVYEFEYDTKTPVGLPVRVQFGLSTVEKSENVHLEFAFIDDPIPGDPNFVSDNTPETR